MSGKHIEVFLVDGNPGGLTTAEIIGWTGHVVAGGRGDLGQFLKRDEATRNGVYLLLGADETAIGGTRCYIGRAEDVGVRLKQHVAPKEFWDRFVTVTTRDGNLTEGHWGYLEARLVDLAKSADRVALENLNVPQGRKLSEAQSSDMEAFIEQLQIVLPVLGVNAIRTRTLKYVALETAPVFELIRPRHGVNAKAQLIDGEFTMLEGSTVVASWHGVGNALSTVKAYASYRAQHERLIADGSILVTGGVGRLTRAVPFSSPSLAGAIAQGRSCNGRLEWTWSGGTFGQWESRDIA